MNTESFNHSPELRKQQTHSTHPFEVGSVVIYPLYGKCKVLAHEHKSIGGQTELFYKLEVMKSPLSRSSKQEPAIWVPFTSAVRKGLRTPASPAELQEMKLALSTREHYFSLTEKWTAVYPRIESLIQSEGFIGLAKAFAYLYVRTKREVIPPSEMNQYFQMVQKNFLREYCEAAHLLMRDAEDQLIKLLRPKLLADL